MPFPLPTNTTCDIYRPGRAPPAAPDVAGVPAALSPQGDNIKTTIAYTHWIDVPLATDVRPSSGGDALYVPDKNGTAFNVVAVERIRFGSGKDYRRAYLKRLSVSWPSDQL